MQISFRLYFDEKTVSVSASRLKGQTKGDSTVYETTVDHVSVVWTHTPHRGGLLVDLKVSSSKALGIHRIDSVVLEAGKPEATERISILGRDAWNNEIRFPHEFGVDCEYCETVVGRYPSLDGKGLMVAGVAPFSNLCKAALKKDTEGDFTFCVKTEYTEGMAESKELCTERAFVHEEIAISELLCLYRDLLPPSDFPMPKLTGWNTWDYYLNEVCAEDVLENVKALKALPFAEKLNYIVIDDGWQKDWGDWRENEKFSCGLPALAESIREAGFLPGIWMAPLGVQNKDLFYHEHPDWFCKNEKGERLFSMGLYYLDPTHPEVRQRVLDNYKYQYDAGFRLFKMDYISPLLEVKCFYDREATPYGVLSQLVEEVKGCTGPDVVVLGCSLPLECGANVAPSMRISLDIHNHFPHVRAIARAIAWASVYNNKITRIDPDFLVVRGEETSDEPIKEEGRNEFYAPPRAKQSEKDRAKLIWRHGDSFNAIEAETWANLVAVSGGNLFLSDRMSVLNERGIAIIERAFAIAGDRLTPVYLPEDTRAPSLWKGDRALVLVNWEEIPRRITVKGIGEKLSSPKAFVQKGEELSVTLLPHESFAALYQ